MDKHRSVGVAVVGHHGCAGNPAGKADQIDHLQTSVEFIRKQVKGIDVIALWVDEQWNVHEIAFPC